MGFRRAADQALVIWGDDIGTANLSCYTHGLMGYRTPNIDRLAKEGLMSKGHMIMAKMSATFNAGR